MYFSKNKENLSYNINNASITMRYGVFIQINRTDKFLRRSYIMELKLVEFTEPYAKEICGWKYEDQIEKYRT